MIILIRHAYTASQIQGVTGSHSLPVSWQGGAINDSLIADDSSDKSNSFFKSCNI